MTGFVGRRALSAASALYAGFGARRDIRGAVDGGDPGQRPVTFAFNGGPG